MTHELNLFVTVMGATIAGSFIAAIVIAQVVAWSKTRDWRKLLGPALVATWVIAALYFVFFPDGGDRRTDLLTFGSAGIIGALLASRAIFGIIRYSRHEVAGNEAYRGSGRDLFVIVLAFVPVLGTVYLLH
ncbi:hypothetical protein [Mesorhizobium sp. M0898]|uniref:hypothetical protein n=1 Tax=Mesorhizobium sp. M0898 TaxID=2957020 RepID=UPI0033375BEC